MQIKAWPSVACYLAVALTACNSCDETSYDVQTRYVDRHRDAFVFKISRDPLVATLRDVLAEQGFDLDDAPPGATTLHARARHTTNTAVEYTVHLEPLQAGGALVELMRTTKDDQGNIQSSIRDTELEWELIQRCEPDRAAKILQAAADRADQVAPRAPRL
jgi:hypothetical protein